MNSTFGLLGERLETRGLFVEYKKNHLKSMPISDFREVHPINLEEIMKLFMVAMPRFDGYFKEMVGEAIRGLERGGEASH